MTSLERLAKRIPEETDKDVLRELLETSKDVILTKLYPLEDEIPDVLLPRKYKTLQLQIAVELYNKQGAEGEISHTENGISRTYDSAFVSEALLKQIIPYGQVISSNTTTESEE